MSLHGQVLFADDQHSLGPHSLKPEESRNETLQYRGPVKAGFAAEILDG